MKVADGRRAALHGSTYFLLIAFVVSYAALARGDNTFPTAETLTNNTTATASGAGQPSIDTHTGSVTYGYHFDLPPGRDGLTPDLTLRYSSSAGPSWVGNGFQFDTPIIHRETRNGVPQYTSADRYVLDVGGSVEPLILVGVHNVDSHRMEYRLAHDPSDVQFILCDDGAGTGGLSAPNVWIVRSRDGSVATYRAAVLVGGAAVATANTYAWRLARLADKNSNYIDYAYGGASGTMMRLTDVWYGANNANPANPIPHLFHVALWDGSGTAPDLLRYSASPTFVNCLAAGRGERATLRPGGVLSTDSGVSGLLRAVGVETVWPGSTDATAHVAATRRVHYWQFHYNWDHVGCHNTGNFWPLLETINSVGTDDAGTDLAEPDVTFDYFSWDRTIASPRSFPTPAISTLAPATTTAQFQPALTTIASNDIIQLTTDHLQPSTYHRWPNALPSRLGGLFDINADGLPDLVDLGSSPRCLSTSTTVSNAQWYQFLGDGSGAASRLGFGTPSSGASSVATGLLPWDQQLLTSSPVSFLGGVVASSWSNCGLEPSRLLVQAAVGAPRQPDVSGADVVLIDFDGDGYVDLLRNEGNDVSASNGSTTSWVFHRNRLGLADPTVSVSNMFDPTGVAIGTPPWWQSTTGGGQGIYPGRNLDVPKQGYTNVGLTPPTQSANDGSLELQAEFGFEAVDPAALQANPHVPNGLFYSSAAAGYLADFTGDGLPDRLVQTNLGTKLEGTLVVYASTGSRLTNNAAYAPGWAASGQIWMNPVSSERRVTPSPQQTISMNRPWSETDGTYREYLSDTAIDLNGDGLADLVTTLPQLTPGTSAGVPLGQVDVFASGFGFLNYGAGFLQGATLWANLAGVRPAWLGITHFDLAGSDGSRPVRRMFQLADYNGDGLPDLISSDGWWLANTGAVVGNGGGIASDVFDSHVYPLAQPSGASWADIGITESAHQNYLSYRQLVADMTGDGRVDILQIGSGNYPNTTTLLYADDVSTGAAPGRLRAIHNGRGGRTEFRYQTLASALAASTAWDLSGAFSGGADHGIPAHAWVVSQVSAYSAESGVSPLITTYQYRTPNFAPQPAWDGSGHLISLAPGFRGFGEVSVCQPGGHGTVEIDSTYAYDTDASGQARDGALMTQVEWDRCSPTGRIRLSEDDYDYGQTIVRTYPGGTVVRNRMQSHIHYDEELDSSTGTNYERSFHTAYAYWAATPLVSSLTEFGATSSGSGGSDPGGTQTRVTATTWNTTIDQSDGTYAEVPLGWSVQGGGGTGLLRHEDFNYDNFTDGATVGRGNLTQRIQYVNPGDTRGSGLITTLALDDVGHPVRITSPTGLSRYTCWDNYALYPIHVQETTGATQETVYSYATGGVLEQRGPTQIAQAVPTPGGSCPARPSAAPNWGWHVAPRTLAGTQPAVADSPTTTLPNYVPSNVGQRTTLYGGSGTATDPAVPSPLVSPTLEVPTTLTAQVLSRYFVTGAITVAGYGTRGTAPGPSGVPTQSAAPATRTTFDGLRRPIRTEVTDRQGDGSLLFTTTGVVNYHDPIDYHSMTFSTINTLPPIDATHTGSITVTVDGFGRITQGATLASDGISTSTVLYTYDASGQLGQVTAPNPNYLVGGTVSQYIARDQRGRVTSAQAYDGAITTYLYRDARAIAGSSATPGLATTTIDGAGRHVVDRVLDPLGRLSQTYQPGSGAFALQRTYTWNAANELTSIVEPDTATTTFAYDQRGLRTTASRYATTPTPMTPLQSTSWVFNSDGYLSNSSDATGSTAYPQDAFGRLSQIVPPSSTLPGVGSRRLIYQDTRSADGYGRVSSVVDPAEEDDFGYDARGRVVGESRSPSFVFGGRLFMPKFAMSYSYNLADQLSQTTIGTAGSSWTFNYDHDSVGNVSRVWDAPGGTARTLARWQYTTANVAQSRTDDFGGTEQTYVDAMGRVTQSTLRDDIGTAFTQTQSYTADGHALITNTHSTWFDGYQNNLTPTYDEFDRLTGATDSATPYRLTATYDRSSSAQAWRVARWSEVAETVPGASTRDDLYQYGTTGTSDPAAVTALQVNGSSAFDVSQSYDGLGSVTQRTTAGTSTLGVDADGRLCSTSAGDVYLYDAYGQRSYVYQGKLQQVTATIAGLLEVTYAASGTGFIASAPLQFLAGLGDAPVARVTAGTNAVALLHRDAQSNVALVRRATTLSHTAERVAFAYGPYGALLHSAGTNLPQELWRYHGGVIDPAGSDFVQFGARRYDPVTRRWASQDPSTHDDLYAFVGGSPLRYSDPSGLMRALPGEGTPPSNGSSPDPFGALDRPQNDVSQFVNYVLAQGPRNIPQFADMMANGATQAAPALALLPGVGVGGALMAPGIWRAAGHGYEAATGFDGNGHAHSAGRRVLYGLEATATFLPVVGAVAREIVAGARIGEAVVQGAGGVVRGGGSALTRGMSRYGGIVSSVRNRAGGFVVTSQGGTQGADFATHVNSGLMRGGPVNILSGVHGAADGVMTASQEILAEDIAMFGDIEGVTIHDIGSLSDSTISSMVNGPGTTIGAFCNSGSCLAPFMQ